MRLGLDIGTKRTGIALESDGLIREYSTLSAADDVVTQIAQICQQEKIEEIIVGLPLDNDGQMTPQSSYVVEVVKNIEAVIKLPIIYEDEYLTTYEAERQMAQQRISPEERERRVDQYSAKLILEQYVNQQGRDHND